MCCCFYGSVFYHLLAWQQFSMGALSPRRRRCSIALQRDSRALAAMFFYGLLLWLAVQSDPYPAPLFAHFFWQDRKSGSPKARLRPCRKFGTSGANRKRSGLLSAPKLSPPPRRSRDFSAAVRRPASTPRPDGHIPTPAGTIQDSTRQARRGHTARCPSWTAR